MSKKILTHDEIVRYNNMATEVQDQVHPRVNFLRQRTKELAGYTADRNAFRLYTPTGPQELTNVFAGMLANPALEKDATKRAELEKVRAADTAEFCALVTRARNKDEDAVHELNGLWMENIDLTIRAMCNFLGFFRPVTVADGDQIKYTHTYRTEVNVKYTSADGGPRTRKAVKAQKHTFFDFEELWSDEVEYQLRDINLGSAIAEMAQKTFDIAWDMEAKLNHIAKELHGTLIGNFTKTGAKLNRTWVKNEYIVESNLPDTNLLTCDDIANTNATLFRIDAIRKIMRYCTRWANVWGRPIAPTGLLYVPSLDATDLSLEFQPTGESKTIVGERIVDGNYLRFTWFDITWTLVPDATLEPGTVYPVLNESVGDFFSKPSQDASYVETYPKKNLERRSAMKAIQFVSPEPKRVFAAKCVYRTP
jgi:hypothetical protein